MKTKKRRTLRERAEAWAQMAGHEMYWNQSLCQWYFGDKGEAAIAGWLAGYRAGRRDRR